MTPITESFHDFEKSRWQEAADGYHSYWEGLTIQTINALLDAVEIRADSKLLDVACGPGYVAGAAAQHGASVTGIDFSKAMLEKASILFPNVEFKEGDAQALAFPANQFDGVTINFGMLHFGEPEKALAESFRVLRSGGRIAYTVWDEPAVSKGFEIVYKAIEEYGSLEVPLPPGPPFFWFSDPEVSCQALLRAGYTAPEVKKIPLTWYFKNSEDFFTAFYAGTARTGPMLRAQSPEALEMIHRVMEEAVTYYQSNDSIEIPMAAMLYHAIKP